MNEGEGKMKGRENKGERGKGGGLGRGGREVESAKEKGGRSG